MLWGAYFADGYYPEVERDWHFDFVWVIADHIGMPYLDVLFEQTSLQFVLYIPLTEARLFGDPSWHAWMRLIWGDLVRRGVADRCLAIQFDDEFYERFSDTTTRWFKQNAVNWPRYSQLCPCDHQLQPAAELLAQRTAEWIAVCGQPPFGFGMSATGGKEVPPRYRGQGWWGCNFYLGAHGSETPGHIHALYAKARGPGIRLMPMLNFYSDPGIALQPLGDIIAAFAPVLASVDFAGIFCFSHPWHGGHGPNDEDAKGLLQLPTVYQQVVRRGLMDR